MPDAAFIKVMMDSPKYNSLFRYFSTSDKTKEIQRKQKQELNVSEKETEEELSAITLAKKKTLTEGECFEPKQNVQIWKFQTSRPWPNLILKIQSLWPAHIA